MPRFELLQLAQHPVELGVGDRGRVQHVVPELVAANLLRQCRVPLPHLGGHVLDVLDVGVERGLPVALGDRSRLHQLLALRQVLSAHTRKA